MKISIIIPCLNEGQSIIATLISLKSIKNANQEIILVDGGSHDDTIDCAKPYVDIILQSKAGRAHQMNHGAKQASGDVLCFLHADSILPDDSYQLISEAMNKQGRIWGRFNIVLSGQHFAFRVIEFFINLRSRLTNIATGDQAIFIRRIEFENINGFAEIPLMEDIEICKRLKRISPPVNLKQKLHTSSRRWEHKGILKTVLLMWHIRFAYFIGTPTDELAKIYRR